MMIDDRRDDNDDNDGIDWLWLVISTSSEFFEPVCSLHLYNNSVFISDPYFILQVSSRCLTEMNEVDPG